MKYQNVKAFLNQMEMGELAPLHLIVVKESAERLNLVNDIAERLKVKVPDAEWVRMDAEKHSYEQLLEEIQTLHLFSSKRIVVCHSFDTLAPKEIKEFPPIQEGVYLVLGAQAMPSVSKLYQSVKKHALCLDLSAEKPWDHRDRIVQELIARAQKANKTLSPEVIGLVIEGGGFDLPGIFQELEKWICYAKDEKVITKRHLEELHSAVVKSLSTWQMAETLIWQQKRYDPKYPLPLPELIAWMGSLRYHLTIGLKLCQKIDNCEQIKEEALFGKLRAQKLNQYASVCRQLGEGYFRRTLQALFELELDAKNDRLDKETLFEKIQHRCIYDKARR